MFYLLFLLILFIIHLTVFRGSNYRYENNSELLIERIKRGKEALDDILKAKMKAEEEYQKNKKRINKPNRNYDKNKKDDYDDNNNNNIYVEEIKCYEYVLEQLNNLNVYNCNEINENNKSLLALAKTKCLFVKSIRSFPDQNLGCILNPKKLNKLQLYLYNNNLFNEFNNENFSRTLNLNELRKIENIINPCYYENEQVDENNINKLNDISNIKEIERNNYEHINYAYNNDIDNLDESNYMSEQNNYLKKKLCENLKYKIVANCTSNKNMSDTAFQIYHSELNHIDDICFYIQSNEWNKRTEENINRLAQTSLYISKQMTTNLENMKLIENAQIKQIENTNKFDNFLKGLKNDFSEIIQILLKIKYHHESITKFLRAFKMIVMYLLIIILVLFITSKSYTYGSRKKIISCVFFCYLTELLFKKLIVLFKRYILLHINDNLISYSIKGIRYTFVIIAIKVFISSIISYKEPAKVIEEELKVIKKIVEKNSQQYQNKIKEIENGNNNILYNDIDQKTISIINLWSCFNDNMDSLYDDDDDFNLSNYNSDDQSSSSQTSLASEKFTINEMDENNDDPIGMRIKTLHRKNRPIFFHYMPSPTNIKAYTENPISFTNMIEYHHNEIMRAKENRINDELLINDHKSYETIILENDDQNETPNIYDINNVEKLNKYYSLDSF
ncbi:nuclear fusion protein, putative [Plasmodium sp. gorilla clade G2]|uniref:nuclear fusion protein, putative n=1 Tax=Plasmodium sp. gorilla clade G2 TaxID=880535 RepID=UPI000D20EA35|nr:nuclear fusion protein, putative [Plasmodium sp. gorilla clade G2]SOV18457.1 nuclear fusion protein, putative [Plasmodium sp. gorilla clade G2]